MNSDWTFDINKFENDTLISTKCISIEYKTDLLKRSFCFTKKCPKSCQPDASQKYLTGLYQIMFTL